MNCAKSKRMPNVLRIAEPNQIDPTTNIAQKRHQTTPNVLLIANQFDPTTNIENCAKMNKSTSYIGKQQTLTFGLFQP